MRGGVLGSHTGARADGPPEIGFVGIHAGRRPGWPVSQNEVLAGLFEQAGYRVRRASTIRQPVLRTLHHVTAILSWWRVRVLVIAVFSGRSFLMSEVATFLGRLTGKHCVVFLHGGGLPDFAPRHRRRVERVLSRADLVLAPSDYLASTFRSWGYDVAVIPNVLDIDQYDYEPRQSARPTLLWMRTFHPDYNPCMAVRVLARIAESHPKVTMTMGGADHGGLEEARAEADRLGVAERIDFAGYLDMEAKRAAFARHDLFLNTNRVDNMPVSVLEASASGLVPVVTAVGGLPSIITDGENGSLVPSDDDEAMALVVEELLAQPHVFAALSAGARKFAEQCSWPQVRQRWETELAGILEGTDRS